MTRVASPKPFIVDKAVTASQCMVDIVDAGDHFVLKNAQGDFYVYKSFVAANGSYYSPGVIGKIIDANGKPVIDDAVPTGTEHGLPVTSLGGNINAPEHGGGGGFGFHAARKNKFFPNKQEIFNWTWDITTRYGLNHGFAGSGFGVLSINVGTPIVSGCVGQVTITLTVGDNSQSTYTVEYHYTVNNNRVDQKITVSGLSGGSGLWVKEPKLVINSLCGHKRLDVIDGVGKKLASFDLTAITDPRAGTMQIAASTRAGVIFSGAPDAAALTVKTNVDGHKTWVGNVESQTPITTDDCSRYCRNPDGTLRQKWEVSHYPSDPQTNGPSAWKKVSTNDATNKIRMFAATDWGLTVGQVVAFRKRKGVAMPTGISQNTNYFIVWVDPTDNTLFQISATAGGAVLNIGKGVAQFSRAYPADQAARAGVMLHAWEGGNGYTDCLCASRPHSGATYVNTLTYSLADQKGGGTPPPPPPPPSPKPPPPKPSVRWPASKAYWTRKHAYVLYGLRREDNVFTPDSLATIARNMGLGSVAIQGPGSGDPDWQTHFIAAKTALNGVGIKAMMWSRCDAFSYSVTHDAIVACSPDAYLADVEITDWDDEGFVTQFDRDFPNLPRTGAFSGYPPADKAALWIPNWDCCFQDYYLHGGVRNEGLTPNGKATGGNESYAENIGFPKNCVGWYHIPILEIISEQSGPASTQLADKEAGVPQYKSHVGFYPLETILGDPASVASITALVAV